MSGIGGLVTLAKPESVPEGASPRTYDWDYDVGGGRTRDGLTSIYATTNEEVGPDAPASATSTTWLDPGNITAEDGSYTSQTPLNVPNELVLTEFAFDISTSSSLTGAPLTLVGFSNVPGTVISAQMLIAGVPVGIPRTAILPQTTAGTVVIGSLSDLAAWGVLPSAAQANAVNFGMQVSASNPSFPSGTAFLDFASLGLGVNTGNANFQYIDTIVLQNGTVKNISMDSNGNFWVENVTTSPGTLTLALEGLTPNSLMVSSPGSDVQYLALTNGFTGSDLPLQYTPTWTDRITQVGPAVSPTFTPVQASSNTFPITSITQHPANSDATDPGHLSVLLQSTGPGSTAPGNVITVYYSPSFVGGSPAPGNEDMILVNAFNSGVAVYVYISGTSVVDGTYLVTSVGNALPPGVDHFRYYFTVQAPTTAYQNIVEAAGQYQLSVATLTTTDPVPGLAVGNQITITGATPTNWNAQWTITQALNSSQMAITGTQVTASVATYNYALSGGSSAAPAAGQLVTVTGTTNADGALNVTNATIVSASGGSTGTFTVSVAVVTASFAPEDGQATTAGTIFAFDPGINVVGTTTSPIFGNTTVGGALTYVAATTQLIATGTKQGSVFFITRNGYWTAPAPPVTFSVPENTTSLNANQIPLGPPNVIARGIILTESGQNGVPGANFFTIPTPVQYIVENVTYTATALIINDNVSTSAVFQFADSILLNAKAVDIYGFNLFNNIEIGDPGWVANYSARNAYGLCRNKIQNFNNLSFDGGYFPTGQLVPLGWTQPDIYGSLVVSPKFGNSYYIQNTSGGELAIGGLISQTAYEDAYQQPIINANTAYSVRVSARIPSGNTTGNLVITLTANGITYGTYTLPFASMTTTYAIFSGTLLISEFPTVPTALMLNISATAMGTGADVEIDRVEPFPTAIPILTTSVFFSYAGFPEQVDAITGLVEFESENQQPVNGGMVLYDTFYGLKGWGGNAPGSSLYSLQASSNLEPAQWQEPEVAQKSGGAVGPLSYDLGEQWFLGASRQGLYLFEGGQPGKIMQEIYQVWDAINWQYGHTIWVKVDIVHRKIFIGVPLSTPNFWLPNVKEGVLNPTSPNVILVCNYQGLDSGQELKGMPQMHTTMFGALNAIDMRRKWSIWQIPSPYANICQGATDEQLFICNGRNNSKVYFLDPNAATDDGIIIDSLYTTAGLPELTKRAQMQGLGNSRDRWNYMTAALQSSGTVQCTLYPNRLLPPLIEVIDGIPIGTYPPSVEGYNYWQVPGGFTPGNPALNDAEAPLNFAATRTFVEFRENDGNGFTLSNLELLARKDVWNQFRGRTGL